MRAVARLVGSLVSSVVRWQWAYRRDGARGLAPQPVLGRPSKLFPRRERLSALSALTVSPIRQRVALYFPLHPHNLRSPQVVDFLRALLRRLRGPVLFTSPSHKSRITEQFLARQRRPHVEPFPPYAPEWSGGIPDAFGELETMLDRALSRLQRSQLLLCSCPYASELPWPSLAICVSQS